MEAMVFEYAQLRGDLTGMDTRVITELAEYYEKEIGYQIPPRTPFVGKNFNVTRAGIHADGLLKKNVPKKDIINVWINVFRDDKNIKKLAFLAGTNGNDFQQNNIVYLINDKFQLSNPRGIWVTDKNILQSLK